MQKMRHQDIKKLRNIGISAHIDAGKTTLAERILYYTGKIHDMGDIHSKDGKGATMDGMPIEQKRGITIQSAATYVDWKDNRINIIDTPGHVDFTVEVERALRVLDGAILVLCAVGGVQSQSITVDRQMKRYGLPCVAFINKCDRAGADPFDVCEQLRDKLGHNAVMVQYPLGLEDQHEGIIDLIHMQAMRFHGSHGEQVEISEIPENLRQICIKKRATLVETLAETIYPRDEERALALLDVVDDVPPTLLLELLAEATIARHITPVCLGSAYKNKGVQALLDIACACLPSPDQRNTSAFAQDDASTIVPLETNVDKPLVMFAFKLEETDFGQLTYCRLYQGQLQKGQRIVNRSHDNQTHKVGRLVQMHVDEMHSVPSAEAGDIVALFGIPCASGDTFTGEEIQVVLDNMHVPEPVVSLAVHLKNQTKQAAFAKAIQRFTREDPTLRVWVDEESGETLFGGMGELHLEVYLERMREEYKLELEAGAPQVAYRETITQTAAFDLTYSKQTGGPGQYAKVVGTIEPTEEEFVFVDSIVGGAIPKEFRPACSKGMEDAMKKGTLVGAPVIGVRCHLTDGKAHSSDSSAQAFRTASRRAFDKAYEQAAPVLLEPVMAVVVETPERFAGQVIGGLNKRRSIILSNELRGKLSVIEAETPLAEMFGYMTALRAATQGEATFSMEFKRYRRVPANVQAQLVQAHQSTS
jgi:elongation factor G